MHILYADESGHPDDKNLKYFVLAGVSVFERQTHWIAKELDDIAARFNPAEPQEVELHGSPMFNRRGFWRNIPFHLRERAIKDALSVLANAHSSTRIFAVGVDISQAGDPPMEYAFLQLASRFDRYLRRLNQRGDKQRGMMLFDKSAHEHALQSLTSIYRSKGHDWGVIRYLSETPAFIDSRASRLIQLADLVAYAIGRKANWNDSRFADIIMSRFDHDGTKMHGLRFFPPSGVDGA